MLKKIWEKTSEILKFEIKWKHILIGFYFENNQKIHDLNNLISTIATVIYKYKMYCRIKNCNETIENVCTHVKKSLKTYSFVYRRLSRKNCQNTFEKISNLL